MKDQIKELMAEDVAGWCDVAKAEVLYDLVQEYRPSIVVEIGTFGGRSVAAFAFALKDLGEGIVFGIDPWEPAACCEGEKHANNEDYWVHLDWESLAKKYFAYLQKYNLLPYHAHFRKKDEKCVQYFADESVGILHIDSNHSEELACKTVHLWWPKLAPGGIIIMDDTDWPGPAKATEIIKEYGASLLGQYDVSASCFEVYRKN